jgi:CubicO group peptidase (beta-lactamase class C family)
MGQPLEPSDLARKPQKDKMGSHNYFPPPEGSGGWRYASSEKEVRELAGLEPRVLALAEQEQQWQYGGDSWAISIIRHGILASEFRTFNILDASRFDIWSTTKSFTSLAFGMILADPVYGRTLSFDSNAYDYIPEGFPLTDERKAEVTIGQLLSMTGGFAGGITGVSFGTPTRIGDGLFEYALGRVPNRYGYDASRLISAPGTRWEYSDPGYAHLSLIFSHVTGQEIDSYLNERLFGPIGVPPVSWTRAGGGDRMGPHTVPHTGLLLSARELARCGYLLLKGGTWDGTEIVSGDWIARVTQPSQPYNPQYGCGFWVNTTGTLWPEVPTDAFAMMGYRGNRCWIVPSLDLVIARTGSGPPVIDDRYFPARVIEAIL